MPRWSQKQGRDNGEDPASGAQQVNTVHTMGLFSAPATSGIAAGGPNQYSPGNGPNFAYPLSREVLLPNSGAITVRAKIDMASANLFAS